MVSLHSSASSRIPLLTWTTTWFTGAAAAIRDRFCFFPSPFRSVLHQTRHATHPPGVLETHTHSYTHALSTRSETWPRTHRISSARKPQQINREPEGGGGRNHRGGEISNLRSLSKSFRAAARWMIIQHFCCTHTNTLTRARTHSAIARRDRVEIGAQGVCVRV